MTVASLAVLAVNQFVSGFFWVGGGAAALCLFKYGFHVAIL